MSFHDNADSQSETVANAVTAMKLEHDDGDAASPVVNDSSGAVKKEEEEEKILANRSAPEVKSRSQSQSPTKKEGGEEREDKDADEEEKVGGDITVRLEPGQPPKLARSSSQKVVPRPPQLFLDLPDSTEEARSTFEVMETCTYANKNMGYTEHAMECDCAEEWGKLFSYPFVPRSQRLEKNRIYGRLGFSTLSFAISNPFHGAITSYPNNNLQTRQLAKIMRVVKTRIVSIARPRLNV